MCVCGVDARASRVRCCVVQNRNNEDFFLCTDGGLAETSMADAGTSVATAFLAQGDTAAHSLWIAFGSKGDAVRMCSVCVCVCVCVCVYKSSYFVACMYVWNYYVRGPSLAFVSPFALLLLAWQRVCRACYAPASFRAS